MTNPLDVPDGMALACGTCGWRPGGDLTVGLIGAHVETEHGTGDIQLELVVLCWRCDTPMTFSHSREGVRSSADFFDCGTCHRRRTIRRDPR